MTQKSKDPRCSKMIHKCFRNCAMEIQTTYNTTFKDLVFILKEFRLPHFCCIDDCFSVWWELRQMLHFFPIDNRSCSFVSLSGDGFLIEIILLYSSFFPDGRYLTEILILSLIIAYCHKWSLRDICWVICDIYPFWTVICGFSVKFSSK